MISDLSDYKYCVDKPTTEIDLSLPILPQRDVNDAANGTSTANLICGVDVAFLLEAAACFCKFVWFLSTNPYSNMDSKFKDVKQISSNKITFPVRATEESALASGTPYGIYYLAYWVTGDAKCFYNSETPSESIYYDSLPTITRYGKDEFLESDSFRSVAVECYQNGIIKNDYLRFLFHFFQNRRKIYYSSSFNDTAPSLSKTESGGYYTPPAISHRNTRCVDRAGKYFLEYAA